MTTEIFTCLAGSRLFGTANENSDYDYKSVHIPSARAILLGTADAVHATSTGSSTQQNSKDDTDETSFPLQKFMRFLAKMETNAIEMLFAPNTVKSALFDKIRNNRMMVLNANKMSFLGFGKSQAMRYAVRGDRLKTLTAVVGILGRLGSKRILDGFEAIEALGKVPNVRIWLKDQPGDVQILHMEVFGREVSMTVRANEALKVFQKPIDEAGKRSKLAQELGGADWKGLYHAHRIVDEGIELFTTGELSFPCRYAQEYRLIRSGELPLEAVLSVFEAKLEQLVAVDDTKTFRAKADFEWIDDFVEDVYRKQVVSGGTHFYLRSMT